MSDTAIAGRSWVLYDAECSLCVALADRFRPLLESRDFRLLPLQAPEAARCAGVPKSERLREMRLLLPDGTLFGGADALVQICRRFWWAWPIYFFGRWQATLLPLRLLYRWVAQHRGCANGACGLVAHRGGSKHTPKHRKETRRRSRASAFFELP